jgi:isoleucyl-tRNA synthetase
MHKSVGNVVSPLEVMAKYGADVVRWWALATDWRNDVRCGDEILQRVAEAYRKVRNTFRFLLGNLFDFDPQRHAVPAASLMSVDRAFSTFLNGRLALIRKAWSEREYHRAIDVLLDLCTVHLSAVFLDVAKDRLYAEAPDAPARRSAQTVLWQALHDLAIAASPALVFTAEEAWQHHPGLVREAESVHFSLLPEPPRADSDDSDWNTLLEVRDAVNAVIEPLRAAKIVATTAEVDVVIRARAHRLGFLEARKDELGSFLMVASVTLDPSPLAADGDGGSGDSPYGVTATRTAYPKCARCWTYRPDVGSGEGAVCGRCAGVLAALGGKAG